MPLKSCTNKILDSNLTFPSLELSSLLRDHVRPRELDNAGDAQKRLSIACLLPHLHYFSDHLVGLRDLMRNPSNRDSNCNDI